MFSKRVARVAAVLSAVALAAACSSDDGAAPAPTETTKETTVPISAVTTAVVDAGAEPRSRITFAPPAGVAQQVVMTSRSDIHQQIGDQPQQDLSTPELTMPLTAVAAAPTPAVSVDLTLGAMQSPDRRLQDALASSEGSKAGLTVQPNGAISALRITPDPGSTDIARSAIEQAFFQAVYRGVAFPDAEIGVGAVWTMEQQVMSGMVLRQVTTATLRERTGDRLTVDVEIRQAPEAQVWDLPGDSGTLNIDTFVMAGTGTLVVDLGASLPVDGSVTVSGEQTYSDPNSTTRLRQATTNTVRWSGQ